MKDGDKIHDSKRKNANEIVHKFRAIYDVHGGSYSIFYW